MEISVDGAVVAGPGEDLHVGQTDTEGEQHVRVLQPVRGEGDGALVVGRVVAMDLVRARAWRARECAMVRTLEGGWNGVRAKSVSAHSPGRGDGSRPCVTGPEWRQ